MGDSLASQIEPEIVPPVPAQRTGAPPGDYLLSDYDQLGATRPLGPGEFVKNADGSWSNEITATVTDPKLNNGRATVIPRLWVIGGKSMKLSEDQAASLAASNSNIAFPSFDSTEEAERFANAREDSWQRVQEGDTASTPPLWRVAQPPATPQDEVPDLKPLVDAHAAMTQSGMDPDDAAAVTRALYAPVMSHGHLQRWLQVGFPIEQPPQPTPQQRASGAAVAALAGKTGAPPQQTAQQMTQIFAGRPYQPPPARGTPTPISELHHYGVLRQVYGPTPTPDDQDTDARTAITGSEPGTRDKQLPAEYYPDSADERHDYAARALTGSRPADVVNPETQDADARLAVGGQ